MENLPEVNENVKKQLALTPLEYSIVEKYANGATKREIAMELGVSTTDITRFFNKKGVLEYTNELINSLTATKTAEATRVIRRIIEDKLEKLEESDGSYSDLTSKDVVDLFKVLSDIDKNTKAEEKETPTYVNIIQQMVRND